MPNRTSLESLRAGFNNTDQLIILRSGVLIGDMQHVLSYPDIWIGDARILGVWPDRVPGARLHGTLQIRLIGHDNTMDCRHIRDTFRYYDAVVWLSWCCRRETKPSGISK